MGADHDLKASEKMLRETSFWGILIDKEELKEKSVNSVLNGDESGNENGDEIRLLNMLGKEPGITAKRISEKTGFSTRKISRIIKQLRESGKITRIGSDRKGYWKING